MKQLVTLFVCLMTWSASANLFFTEEMIQRHLQGYSEEEIGEIKKDLTVVRSICLDDAKKADRKFYLATAGGPGARKTTILERFLSSHPEYQQGVYLDPDPRTLRFMVHTYYASSLSPLCIAQKESYDTVIQDAYNKWRAASNYIVLTLLEEAFSMGHSIVYGTTSTGAHIPSFFKKLQENDYEIVLLLCSCPDTVRFDAVQYRNQTVRFYQSSPEDALAKGKLFPQRMKDFFAYADQIYLFWSDDLFGPERLAAIWQKDGTLEVRDPEALERFIEKYEIDRLALQSENIALPAFETYLQNSMNSSGIKGSL